MEQLFNDMMESYDIQSAGHVDTLKMICKASLKCNQLVDLGDVDGFQKMARVYDSLMKSGRFTEAQQKDKNSEDIDSVGELVVLCEKEGFIPRYYTDKPKDRVDETLYDYKHYVHNLITNEMNLGNLIEGAVKQMSLQEQQQEDIEDEDDENNNTSEASFIKSYQSSDFAGLNNEETLSANLEYSEEEAEAAYLEFMDFMEMEQNDDKEIFG